MCMGSLLDSFFCWSRGPCIPWRWGKLCSSYLWSIFLGLQRLWVSTCSLCVSQNSCLSHLLWYIFFPKVVHCVVVEFVAGLLFRYGLRISILSRAYEWFDFQILPTGKLLLNLMDHTEVVRDLTFAPDGSLILVSASRDKTLRVWDLKDDGMLIRNTNCREI